MWILLHPEIIFSCFKQFGVLFLNWGYSCFTMLISAVQWSESAIGMHRPLPSWTTLRLPAIPSMQAKSLQSCLTLCDPMDCSLPGSSVLWVLQASMLSGLPFPLPGDLPDPGIEPVSLASPALIGGFFTTMPPGKHSRTTHWADLPALYSRSSPHYFKHFII